MNRSVQRPLIGLDVSTKTGVCIDGERSLVAFGSVSKGDRLGELDRLQRVWLWACTLPPTAIVFIEGYSFGDKHRAIFAGEFGGVIRTACMTRGIPFVEVPPTSLKKYASGRGNKVDKSTMRMELFKRTGIDEQDDNLVDAHWLYLLGADYLDRPEKIDMPQVNRAVLSKLTPHGPIGKVELLTA